MSIADKALWIIERNSQQSLTLTSIAQACGVSRSHLAFAFGTAAGLPVMKYLRARRLSEAARALAAGARDILALALDNGYSSHEAFTRAFREQFGMTPEAVRDRNSVDGLTLITPLELKARGRRPLEPARLTEQGAVRVVGLSETCSFETTIKIPALWQRFMAHYAAIPSKLHEIPLGLSRASNDEGEFEYTCGVEVAHFGETPRGLQRFELPPRKYAVFEHRTHVSTLTDTYWAIWNEALPSLGRTVADAPVLERHNPEFNPGTGEGGVTLWVPLDC